jgi:hypothetical protein
VAESKLEVLTRRANTINEQYRKNFAGRSRISRDASMLDTLIADVQQVAVEAGSLAGAGESLLPTLRDWESVYRTEREAIRGLQAQGDDAVTAARLHDAAWLSLQRYQRQFAGHRRATRDVALLAEQHSQALAALATFNALGRAQDKSWMPDTRSQLTGNADLYGKEVVEIRQARKSLAPDERARALATVANGQFDLWRRHFQDQPRRTRRPALLERVAGALEAVQAEMEAVRDGGVRTEAHLGNITKVKDRAAHYRRELEQVRKARAGVRPADLAGLYGDEANVQFKRYRENFTGKSRLAVDLATLEDLCERLHELRFSMDELDREYGLAGNLSNLGVVNDNLKGYEREYANIVKARKNK